MLLSHYSWRVALTVFIVLLLLMLAANQSSLLYLAKLWDISRDGPYAHGYLVLGISLYLIYERRQQLARLSPCISLWGGAAVAAVLLLNLAAILVDVQVVMAVSLLLMLLSLIWFVFGWSLTKQLLFPVLFIVYALPVWGPLSLPLQQITADASFWIIRVLDMPAWLDGNVIVLPSGALSVERSCAGLNYLMAALTLSTLYAYLNYATWRARLLVVLVAATMAVLSNIIRVTIVVYLAYKTDMQHPYVEDHLSLGWTLFAGLTILLLLLDWLLHRGKPKEGMPEQIENRAHTACYPKTVHEFSVLVITLLLLLPLVLSVPAAGDLDANSDGIPLPAAWGKWEAVPTNIQWFPQYAGALGSKQSYRYEDDEITLYLGYYPAQQQGRELINDLNRIYKPTVWRKINLQAIDYVINSIPFKQQVLENGKGDSLTIWYWYEVAGIRTTNELVAKLLQAYGLMTGRHQAAVFALATSQPDIDDSRRILGEFLQHLDEQILHVETLLNREGK